MVGGVTELGELKVIDGDSVLKGGDLGRKIEELEKVVVEGDVVEGVLAPGGVEIEFGVFEFFFNGRKVPFRGCYPHIMIEPPYSLVVGDGHVVQFSQVS